MNVTLSAGWVAAVLELAEAIGSGGDVSELVARVEANESGVSSNSLSISSLDSRLTTSESVVGDNTSDIAALTSALSDLGDRVAAIEDASPA